MAMNKEIERHWEKLYSLIDENAIDDAVMYCKELNQEEYQKVEEKLLNLLKETNDACIRNTTAIVLGDLHCNEAIPVLIALLSDARCRNCRGSLIYAFEGLDCADRIIEFFPLIYEGNCEVRFTMYGVMEEKIPFMKAEDIAVCKGKLMKKMERVEEELNFLYDTAEELFGVDFEKEEEEENAGEN